MGRRIVFAAAFAVAAVYPPALITADDPMAGIKAGCAAEWPDDYSMQEFCIDNQSKSLSQVADIYHSNQDDQERAILAKCYKDWRTATGSNWVMVEFCYQQQHDAYKCLGN
ncbi:hypothetical protein [Mesorhizobium australafricanum]|uniref:Uncharacterized protein n=1 Tax=Mesorhizobium australafricanum TaxID=3072311 RepID=A0ABU4X6B2_9HYPH|nr:hypothetical protein [Mesorhizobium sp. VK3E]MDX8443866.1 hypothetical protein [Mesorhizobium sp. VK3E]